MDDAQLLLLHTREVAGGVHHEDQRDRVGVAQHHVPSRLLGGVDVQRAGQVQGLIGDHAHRLTVDAREARDDVGGELPRRLHELAVVEHPDQHVVHVVRGVVRVRDDRVELPVRLRGLRFESRVDPRGLLAGRRRQVAEQVAHVHECVVLADGHVVDVAPLRLLECGPELVHRDVLAGHLTDDVGAGDEHVRLILDGDHEVGRHGRVHGTARALAEHDRDLRNVPRRGVLTPRDLRVVRERGDGVLDPGAARVVDPDDRAADLDREIHDGADLLAEALADGPAEHRVVVRVHRYRATVDRAAAGHHAVAERVVGVARRLDQLAHLHEAARVEELGDPLAGRGLPRGVAAGLGPFAARVHGLLGLDPQFSELLRGRLRRHAFVPFRTPASSSVSRRARCLPTVPTTGSSTIARWSPSRWTTSRSVTTAAQPPSGSMRS